MRTIAHHALAGVALLGLLAETSARWEPAVGEEIEWRWRIENELELVGLSYRFGEQDNAPLDAFRGNDRLEVRDLFELVARDRLVELDEREPSSLERRLVRARRSTRCARSLLDGEGSPDGIVTVSRLEGAQLLFEADAKAGHLTARFDGDEDRDRDEELLGGLEEELDLRSLLGEQARAPGDRWRLDEDAIRRLLRPGGELTLVASEADLEGEHESAVLGWLLGAALLAGEADAWGSARYERVSQVDGGRLARIRLRLQIEAAGEVREQLVEQADSLASAASWLEQAEEIRVDHELSLEGILMWELDARRASSLELYGLSETTLEILTVAGAWPSALITAEFRGNMSVEVEARGPER